MPIWTTTVTTANKPDTIAAFSTPPGISGIAVLRLSGPDSVAIGDTVFTSGPLPGDEDRRRQADRPLAQLANLQARFGYVHRPGLDEPIDQAIALRFVAPHSYTGEDVIEFSLHGGQQVRQAFLAACLEAGACAAGPGEYSRRAFMNGKLDLAEAEAVMDLIDADAGKSAEVALRQLSGQLSRRIAQVRESLYGLAAALEVGIEYPEYEDFQLRDEELPRRLAEAEDQLQGLLDGFRQGRVLREGFRVVLAGPPNAGKSTLLNLLSGEDAAIVTSVPGTTRDALTVEVVIGGVPYIVTDTAGLRDSTDEVERIGIERARSKLGEADLVCWLVDGARDWRDSLPDEETLEAIGGQTPVLILDTKQDLVDTASSRSNRIGLQRWFAAARPGVHVPEVLGISSEEPASVDRLRSALQQAYDALGSGQGEAVLLTRERHRDAVARAKSVISRLRTNPALPDQIVADALRTALEALGEVTGEAVEPTLVDEIFSRFCIGK